jgi:hypothetical protein
METLETVLLTSLPQTFRQGRKNLQCFGRQKDKKRGKTNTGDEKRRE